MPLQQRPRQAKRWRTRWITAAAFFAIMLMSPALLAQQGWLVGPVLSGDIMLLPEGDLCSQDRQRSDHHCIRADGERYVGAPLPSRVPLSAGYGTTRISLHVEHPVFEGLHLGGRIGFAFGDAPALMPLHLEARASYWFGEPLNGTTGVRFYVGVAAGMAEMSASRQIRIQECRDTDSCQPALNLQPGAPNPDNQTVRAHHTAGLGFGALSAGLMASFWRGAGFLLELRAQQLFPTLGTAFSPTLGYVVQAP